ncbi:hypothetical protein ACWEPL_62905, partial [Nonomuraea sp. NPDC004186]
MKPRSESRAAPTRAVPRRPAPSRAVPRRPAPFRARPGACHAALGSPYHRGLWTSTDGFSWTAVEAAGLAA